MPNSNRSRDCSAVKHAPVLTPQLLERIHQLNLDYLNLILDAPVRSPCPHLETVPSAVQQALMALPATALESIAAAPFALYSLGFDDQQFWSTALGVEEPAAACAHVAEASADTCRIHRHSGFCETVIFFAWHVAVANRLAARMLFGMPTPVIECLQAATFSKLQQVMHTCPWLLVPRWACNPRFWPDLTKFAALGASHAVRDAHLLGTQLLACDLRGADAPPLGASRLRPRTRSMQLHRWKMLG